MPALSSIIGGSIRVEVCNNQDDDCDGIADEGLPKFCDLPHGVKDKTLCEEPDETKCDGKDDDCDGTVDEGLQNRCGKCGAEPRRDLRRRRQRLRRQDRRRQQRRQLRQRRRQLRMKGMLECVGGGPNAAARSPRHRDLRLPGQRLRRHGRRGRRRRAVRRRALHRLQCVTHCTANDEFVPTCPAGLAPTCQDIGECLCVQNNCDAKKCAGSQLERDGEVACAPHNDTSVTACGVSAGECTARCDGVHLRRRPRSATSDTVAASRTTAAARLQGRRAVRCGQGRVRDGSPHRREVPRTDRPAAPAAASRAAQASLRRRRALRLGSLHEGRVRGRDVRLGQDLHRRSLPEGHVRRREVGLGAELRAGERRVHA